jgi:hypothetical protein
MSWLRDTLRIRKYKNAVSSSVSKALCNCCVSYRFQIIHVASLLCTVPWHERSWMLSTKDARLCNYWSRNFHSADSQTLQRLSPQRVIQVRSKDSQVKTQPVLWMFILFKVTRWLYVSASITRPRCILSLWDSFLWITVSSFHKFFYLLVTWWWPGDRGRNMLSL